MEHNIDEEFHLLSLNHRLAENVDRNLLYLNYNLNTGYLSHDEVEVVSLQKLCILTAVVKAFECDEAVKEMRKFLNAQGDNLFGVVENILSVELLPPKFAKEIKLEIRLVFKEMYRFLESIFWKDKFAFLGNFVFNTQGSIHPRNTVLKVLNCSTLKVERKFEFSCKYLFDEEIIRMYFIDLGDSQNFYSNSSTFYGLFGFIYHYWVWKIRRPPADLKRVDKHGLMCCSFFLSYIQTDYCTDIGVQFLFENFKPIVSVVSAAIESLLASETFTFPKINVLMYLIYQIRDNNGFNRHSYMILVNLIKNPRWHDMFIRYFTILKNEVDGSLYIKLLSAVITKLLYMINVEGKGGKYFIILKDFIELIPITAKRTMKNNFYTRYVLICFSLLVCEDIEIIRSLFWESHIIRNVDVSEALYALVTGSIHLFSKVHGFPSSNIERFLRKVIKSEDQISELLRKWRWGY
ncbi:UNVERIFIED_CONTAM: hypothetical protein RMT77_011785 [Armadillidium vulgare]